MKVGGEYGEEYSRVKGIYPVYFCEAGPLSETLYIVGLLIETIGKIPTNTKKAESRAEM